MSIYEQIADLEAKKAAAYGDFTTAQSALTALYAARDVYEAMGTNTAVGGAISTVLKAAGVSDQQIQAVLAAASAQAGPAPTTAHLIGPVNDRPASA